MPATPHPWRRLPTTAKAPTKRSLGSLKRALGKRQAIGRLEPVRAGIAAAPTRALGARMAAALELVEGLDADALAEAPDQLLGDAERVIEWTTSSTLTHAVAAHLGLPRALALRVAAEAVQLDAGYGGWTTAIWLTDEPAHRRPSFARGWDALRHAVCAAESDAYAAAVAWVVAHPSDDPVVQRRLAATFPDEPWAAALLAEELAKGSPDRDTVAELLIACSDPASMGGVAALDGSARLVADAAPDLAAVLPPDASVPLLAGSIEALLVKPSYGPLLKTPPRQVADALTSVGDEASARVMASYLGHRVLGVQAVRFFETHPQHAAFVAEHDPELHRRLAPVEPVSFCAEDQVPELLATRRWREVRHQEEVVRGLVWPHPVEERFVGQGAPPPPASRPMNAAELEAWRAEEGHRRCDLQAVYTRGGPTTYLEVPAEEGLAVWNAGKGYVHDEARWAHRHGVAALPGFLSGRWARWLDEEHGKQRLALLQGMHTPAVVPAFVELFHRKRWRGTALRWLFAHARTAAIGLIPLALGPRGTARKRAQDTLLALARTGKADTVREVADRYGEAASRAVRDLLARPHTLQGKPPKRPDWLRVEALVAPRVEEGALPADAVDALVELLSLNPSGQEYPVDLPLEPDSVDAFVSALLEHWVDHDAPGRHDWMLRAVRVLPAPTARRRVAELARSWAHKSKAKALRTLPVLAEIGDERSLLALSHIAHSSRIQAVKKAAHQQLARVAQERGWSRDELDDRTVPTLGLDPRGGLDLGHRGVRAQVTSELTVQLLDAEGAPLRSLPRAGDDPEVHRVAKQRLSGLRKDLKAIAARQCQRLEAAMVSGRTWSLVDARRWLFDAPLLSSMVRALVWTCDGVAFRVAEDGSFADVDDEPIAFATGRVAVAHPLQLPVDAWATLLADYECIQPFQQLGRPVYRRDTSLARVGPVEGRKALGRLEARGWDRVGGGWVTGWRRGTAEIRAEPGIEVAYLRSDQPVHLRPGPLDALDDVAFSELAHDLLSWA